MKQVVWVLLLLSLVGIIVGFFYLKFLLSPLDSDNQTTQIFLINKNQSFQSIADNLTKSGLIRSPLSLKLAAYQSTKGKNIQAGSFRLSPSMSPRQILDEFSHGKLDIWVTIIEGWRREEIAQAIKATFSENNLAFNDQEFLNTTKNDEGYLFPDKYLFPINTDEGTIVSILKNTLDKKLTPLNTDIKKSGHTLHEILTMASLIEREAKTTESRKIISGILWKRIAHDWPLQVDATLQYAKGYDSVLKDWWKSPLAKDKDINSFYNTYKYKGLPPGPICSPSLSSIEAALYPENSDYWYYLTDNQGVMHYSATVEQHNQYVNLYLR